MGVKARIMRVLLECLRPMHSQELSYENVFVFHPVPCS